MEAHPERNTKTAVRSMKGRSSRKIEDKRRSRRCSRSWAAGVSKKTYFSGGNLSTSGQAGIPKDTKKIVKSGKVSEGIERSSSRGPAGGGAPSSWVQLTQGA